MGGAEAHARFRQYEYRAVSCASQPPPTFCFVLRHREEARSPSCALAHKRKEGGRGEGYNVTCACAKVARTSSRCAEPFD